MPKEDVFFVLMKKQASVVCKEAALFGKFLRDYNVLSPAKRNSALKAIIDAEHEGDELTHEIIALLHKSFITPIDREDIYSLVHLLDDLIDLMDEIANKLIQYNFDEIPDDLFSLTAVALKALQEVFEAVSCLQKPKSINVHLRKIHDFEDEADKRFNNSISVLFRKEKNAVNLIKLKELYERAEALADKAQHVAIVIEGIVVKHA